MKKDSQLEEMFLHLKPTFTDENLFMERLQHRLDAVELVQRFYAERRRRYRRAACVALSFGIPFFGILLFTYFQMSSDSFDQDVFSRSGLFWSILNLFSVLKSHLPTLCFTWIGILIVYRIMNLGEEYIDVARLKGIS